MARRPRSAQIENRSNRLKLEPRRKPYFSIVSPGISLGYRRTHSGAGTWNVKAADGRGGHWLKVFAVADDYENANGASVLTYWQAIDKARSVARSSNDDVVSGDRPITVGEALADYQVELESRNGDGRNVSRVRRHLMPALAGKTVAQLSAKDLRVWRDSMLKRGLKPASADRSARALKAALALAAREDHRITNTAAWRDGLARLPDAEIARNAIMSDDDVRALVAAAYKIDAAFGLWIEAHAITGARTSQLERLTVADLQDDGAAPRLMMPSSRKGRRKRIDRKPVPIPATLAQALRKAATDRAPDALLLLPPSSKSTLQRWFRRARTAAGLDATVVLYGLRHSSVTRQLMAGVPTQVVASTHDTSTAMLTANYAAFISSVSDALTRRALLDLTPPRGSKVVPLGRKR
jgi:site-specific recombinase XerD